jgi:hypothetical protein
MLHHPMTLDQWVHDIATAQTTKPLQSHGVKTFLKIEQIIRNHQSVTSRAGHELPPFGLALQAAVAANMSTYRERCSHWKVEISNVDATD